jgi:hypothetical protein
MNVVIFIRKFKIMIEDSSVRETAREMIDSKLVFCKDHNLLMYSKSIMIISRNLEHSEESDEFDSDKNSSDSENEISDVKDSASSFH